MEVLEALLRGFHNSCTGCCFPSYEAIAAKAECCRDTVCEALKALEWAGVLTWQNRITRIVGDPNSPLERALARFGAAIEGSKAQ